MANQDLTREHRSLSENRKMAQELHDGVHLHEAVSIRKSPKAVYSVWRDMQNWPHFMQNLESIEILSAAQARCHWQTKETLEFEFIIEIFVDEPGRVIAWKTLPEQKIQLAGSIRFSANHQGCEVRVQLVYDLPGGKITDFIAKIISESPAQILHRDLRCLKALIETGEIASIEEQPKGSKQTVIATPPGPLQNLPPTGLH